MTDIYITRASEVAARKVDGEMVILSGKDSSLFVLNEIGTALWEAADGCTPLAMIVESAICTAYDVDASTAMSDALEFVESLEQHGILRRSSQPVSGESSARHQGDGQS